MSENDRHDPARESKPEPELTPDPEPAPDPELAPGPDLLPAPDLTPAPEPTTLLTSPRELLGITTPERLTDRLTLTLTERTYLPKADERRRDWVATVALPAMSRYALRHGTAGTDVFATIGTGAGVDALCAIEVLAPSTVLVTDLHEEVVQHAVANIHRNTHRHAYAVEGLVGSLGEPLRDRAGTIDLLYENLPNIPAPVGMDLDAGRATATFVDTARLTGGPEIAHQYLLALHCALLAQARDLLSPRGRVICSIGARVPLARIVEAVGGVGFTTRPLLYTWKIQSEAESVIDGYAREEGKGAGPFHFYPVDTLERVFGARTPEQAADDALAIEAELADSALGTATARKMTEAGLPVGHTVVALEATPGDSAAAA